MIKSIGSDPMNPERIGGYDILSELGRGAMGVVYHAHDKAIDRPVAIKVIRIDPGTTAQEGVELRQRLIREASTAGKISHPGIVTVHQLGEEGDNVFIVMEFVEGSSLEKVLSKTPPPDLAWCLDALAQIAVALDYAHKSGVVHRDIKPANILVREDGRVKIADFGIAKMTAGATSMTAAGVSLGSPAYMSPEQIQAAQIDGRSDQFALATIAFLMLTGRMPFKGNTAHTLMYQIVTGDPFEPIPGDNPLLPGVRAVLARALAKHPRDRYPNCALFIQELTAAVSSKGSSTQAATVKIDGAAASRPVTTPPPVYTPASAPPPRPAPTPVYATPASAPPRSAPSRRKTPIALPIIAGLLVLTLLGGGIYWYTTTCCAPPAQPQPSTSTPPSTPDPKPVATDTPSRPPEEKKPASPAPTPSAPAKPHVATAGANPLMQAVAEGKFDVVKSLIATGANVNAAAPDGTTPLMVAAEGTEELQQSGRMVKLLLSAHARPDAVDAQGRSALYRSAAEGRPNAMTALLDEHANPNQQANDGSTPLMEAVKFARPAAARILLEHGADVNLADANRITPLMVAAQSSEYIKNPAAYIKMLLHHGAKRGLKDSRGRIAFQYAVETKNQEAITALR